MRLRTSLVAGTIGRLTHGTALMSRGKNGARVRGSAHAPGVISRLNLVPVQRYFKAESEEWQLMFYGRPMTQSLASIRELIFPHGLM